MVAEPGAEAAAPQRLSADERRESLLDVARSMISETGPGGITMGAVAARAGVTRALLYKHFANKNDLLVALYRREARRIDRAIRAEIAEAPESFEPKLRAFIGTTLRLLDAHAPFFTPLREAGANPRARTDQHRRDRRTVGYFAELAEREFGIAPRTARSVIAVLFTGIRSLLAQMKSSPGPTQHEFLLETYVAMTIGALTSLAENPPAAEGPRLLAGG